MVKIVFLLKNNVVLLIFFLLACDSKESIQIALSEADVNNAYTYTHKLTTVPPFNPDLMPNRLSNHVLYGYLELSAPEDRVHYAVNFSAKRITLIVDTNMNSNLRDDKHLMLDQQNKVTVNLMRESHVSVELELVFREGQSFQVIARYRNTKKGVYHGTLFDYTFYCIDSNLDGKYNSEGDFFMVGDDIDDATKIILSGNKNNVTHIFGAEYEIRFSNNEHDILEFVPVTYDEAGKKAY